MKVYKVLITSEIVIIAPNEDKAEEIAENKISNIPSTFNAKIFSISFMEDLAHRGKDNSTS